MPVLYKYDIHPHLKVTLFTGVYYGKKDAYQCKLWIIHNNVQHEVLDACTCLIINTFTFIKFVPWQSLHYLIQYYKKFSFCSTEHEVHYGKNNFYCYFVGFSTVNMQVAISTFI